MRALSQSLGKEFGKQHIHVSHVSTLLSPILLRLTVCGRRYLDGPIPSVVTTQSGNRTMILGCREVRLLAFPHHYGWLISLVIHASRQETSFDLDLGIGWSVIFIFAFNSLLMCGI